MSQPPEVERLLIYVDQFIVDHADSNDREIQKFVKKLKRFRKKFDARDVVSFVFKVGWIVDKISDLIDLV